MVRGIRLRVREYPDSYHLCTLSVCRRLDSALALARLRGSRIDRRHVEFPSTATLRKPRSPNPIDARNRKNFDREESADRYIPSPREAYRRGLGGYTDRLRGHSNKTWLGPRGWQSLCHCQNAWWYCSLNALGAQKGGCRKIDDCRLLLNPNRV
jgi:hypothetical protein